MKSPLKEPLAAQVARDLRERLVKGHEGEMLPGVRVMARILGVCVPTVSAALRLLADEGWVAGGGHRRRWLIAGGDRPQADLPDTPTPLAQPGKTVKNLLFLTSNSLATQPVFGFELLAALLRKIHGTGWDISHRAESFAVASKPRRPWDEWLLMEPVDALVVLTGTPALGTWAMANGIRTLFVGGDSGNTGVPMLAVRVITMLRDAASRLFSTGHRRALLPLFARPARMAALCRRTARELYSDSLGFPQRVVIAESRYAAPEITVNLLRQQWLKNPPDALILLDWREFVAASAFLREAGLEIPRDLSVIVLSQDASMDWHLPSLCHYRIPTKKMVKIISKWLEPGATAAPPFQELQADWVPNDSVFPRVR